MTLLVEMDNLMPKLFIHGFSMYLSVLHTLTFTIISVSFVTLIDFAFLEISFANEQTSYSLLRKSLTYW